jgi:hypothetical protein
VFVCGVFEVLSVVDGENEMGEVRGDEDVVKDVETGVDEVEGALGTGNGDETVGGDEGRGNSKISTTFEYPLLPTLLL